MKKLYGEINYRILFRNFLFSLERMMTLEEDKWVDSVTHFISSDSEDIMVNRIYMRKNK